MVEDLWVYHSRVGYKQWEGHAEQRPQPISHNSQVLISI